MFLEIILVIVLEFKMYMAIYRYKKYLAIIYEKGFLI